MRRALALLTIVAAFLPTSARALPPMRPPTPPAIDLVDPTIGTLGAGFVFPGPSAPYGMVQNSPDTEGYFAYTGYQYADHNIRGFSLVHTESMGVSEGGQIPFMPTTGDIVTDVKQYESPFTHATETASPGYYSAKLLRYGIDAELTAGTRVAMQRYTFPATAATGNVLIDVGREVAGSNIDDVGQTTPGTTPVADAEVVAPDAIAGHVVSDDHYPVNFYARFDRPFVSHGVWSGVGGAPHVGDAVSSTKGGGIFATFDTAVTSVVRVKIGVSFVSVENARLNLESELPGDGFDFDALIARTRAAWIKALRAIDVEGFDQDQLKSFYTALFHAQQHPNIFQDVNGDYLGYDGAVHRVGAPGDPMPADSTYYANYSFWDTYRAEMPLLMLIAPARVRDMMYSLNAIAKQGGRIPRWGWMDQYADFMNGEPGINVVADAFCRGLVPSEIVSSLYDNMRSLALDPAHHRDPVYLEKGYIPWPGNGASGTLEHAINDFALALVANKLQKDDDRAQLLALANNWKNIFDPSIRFMRPKDGEGNWADNTPTGYAPEVPDGWKEGTGWQYTMLVPQDFRGLFDAIGAADGDAYVQQRLDEFFAPGFLPYAGPEFQQKISAYGITYYGNQYAPSNEHDLQATWAYNWIGQPWKTQMLQRSMQSIYRDTPDGLPGNDDLGTMSAWFIWSALGLYPTTPGSPTFTIGSPLFNHATIHRADGDIQIDSQQTSFGQMFVQNLLLQRTGLEDDAITRPWITWRDLKDGARLDFSMGSVPNMTWGSARADMPPSASTAKLTDFGC